MSEFKWDKEKKALDYAKNAWGIYFNDTHPDPAITDSVGEITQKDYLAGYEQALRDSFSNEMLEMLIRMRDSENWDITDYMDLKELITKATTA